MDKVVFVADYFFDEIIGGAEKYNNVLISYLENHFAVEKIKSANLSLERLRNNSNSFFIIANFFQLKEDVKEYISQNIKYVIIEHDHKYLINNNPVHYDNYLGNEENLQNINFYKKSLAVFCQSTLHTEILYKNTLLKNLVNLKGNIWTDEELNYLKSHIGVEKRDEYAILQTNNKNKGMSSSIHYCNENNIEYTLIPNCNYEDFIEKLSKVKALVFLPTWVESFNRVSVEARILGCRIITNNRIGCASDNFLDTSGHDLLLKVEKQTKKILKTFHELIKGTQPNFYEHKLPRVSVITTFADGEEYLRGFLNSCLEQTIFDEIDFYIYDAASTGNEQEIIEGYTQKYNNIHYYRDKNKLGSSLAFNKMIESSPNELVSMISLDDRPAPHYAEILRKYLTFSETDLVYGDCYQTHRPNETFNKNSSNKIKYLHSLNDFSHQNMIKSLAGPMPMFKKKMIKKNGGFNVEYKHANDWELWLRCVDGGSNFFKVHTPVGLYYFNPNGVTTAKKHEKKKREEERKIFYKYRHIIGERNFQLYKTYFDQIPNVASPTQAEQIRN
jgi:hypothetical protein